VSGSGISWAACKSAPRSRQITTPAPHHSVFYRPDALPAAQPTASKHWRHQHATHNLRHNSRQLSDKARQAKQLQHSLGHQYKRTGLDTDKRGYQSACLAARDSVMTSRAGHIKSQLDGYTIKEDGVFTNMCPIVTAFTIPNFIP